MHDFKVGDRVRILPGVATPFVGMDGTICEVRPHDQGQVPRPLRVRAPLRAGRADRQERSGLGPPGVPYHGRRLT